MKKLCKGCNKEFKSRGTRRKFCSWECYQKWNVGNNHHRKGKFTRPMPHCPDCGVLLKDRRSKFCKKHGQKGKRGSNYVDGRTINKKCIDCGIPISRKGDNKRCRDCYALSITGENAPNWKNGLGNLPYPMEFNDRLKKEIRERDNYICMGCEITEEEHIIVYGQCLSIHHIDYIKTNLDKRNLITLCHACNARANYNRDIWKEHYDKKICDIYADTAV